MNAHEFDYCQYLLQEIRNLRIENEAMATMLDNPSFSVNGWRVTTESLAADEVFRSAVEANFAPYFERLRRARGDSKTLLTLQAAR